MLNDEIRKLIKESDAIHINDAYEQDRIWKLMTELLSKDINRTIEFFGCECTNEEFVCLSAIFEDIAEATQSLDYIECLKKVAAKFPEECKIYNIVGSIEIAENHIGGGR